MSKQRHFMKKGAGPVIQVKLNEWPKYRRDGYEFTTEQEFNEQSHGKKAEAAKVEDGGSKKKKKKSSKK